MSVSRHSVCARATYAWLNHPELRVFTFLSHFSHLGLNCILFDLVSPQILIYGFNEERQVGRLKCVNLGKQQR